MIRVCYRCGQIFGEKEPLDDHRPTHGLCEPCFAAEIEDIRRRLGRMVRGSEIDELSTRVQGAEDL